MVSAIIQNKADFQRHLNGCERRLNDLNKSLEKTEKFGQQLLLNQTNENRTNFFEQLNGIQSEIKFLYSNLSTLEQSIFNSNGNKRLDKLQQNLRQFCQRFQQIQQYAQTKFDYYYSNNQFDEYTTEQQEQLVQLITKQPYQEQIELDLLDQHTVSMNHIEKDIVDLHDAFIDLHRIIHDQGTMVNNIEDALATADEMIIEANETVQQTVQTAKRTRHLKWILISILIFICFLIVTVLIFLFKSSSIYS